MSLEIKQIPQAIILNLIIKNTLNKIEFAPKKIVTVFTSYITGIPEYADVHCLWKSLRFRHDLPTVQYSHLEHTI